MYSLDDRAYYESLTNKELIQVATCLNREKYPERYSMVRSELEVRNIKCLKNGNFEDPQGLKDPNGPRGMGGGLFLFCISAILNSLQMTIGMWLGFKTAAEANKLGLSLMVFGFVDSVVICFGAYVVWELVSIRERAVCHTKTYLKCVAGLGLLIWAIQMYRISGTPDATILELAWKAVNFDVIRRFWYATFWYLYFQNSTRVANTYTAL